MFDSVVDPSSSVFDLNDPQGSLVQNKPKEAQKKEESQHGPTLSREGDSVGHTGV